MTLVNKSFKTDRGMACFRGMILLHRGPRFMFNSQLILKETLSGLIIPNPFVKFNAFFSFVSRLFFSLFSLFSPSRAREYPVPQKRSGQGSRGLRCVFFLSMTENMYPPVPGKAGRFFPFIAPCGAGAA